MADWSRRWRSIGSFVQVQQQIRRANVARGDVLRAPVSEPEGAASRGRLIPFGRLPGVPVDTRLPPKVR
jgi:hypothetical protein